MNDQKEMRETLLRISELIDTALQHPQDSAGDFKLQVETPSDHLPVGCSIKSLPNRLLKKAAETAISINPVNAPVLGPMTELAVDGVMDPQFLTVLTGKYWGPTPRRLTVSFMESTPAELRRRIIDHMNAWSKTACISFSEAASGAGHVRISRRPGGYWSYLGTDILFIPRDRPTMNLEGFAMDTPEEEFIRVVRHETGHTLGFPHEHMREELVKRIDPEKAYAYFWRTQRWDRRTVDQQVLTPLIEPSIMGTPADETSIMCYQLPGAITRDGRPITGGLDINATDYAFAGKIYPKPKGLHLPDYPQPEMVEAENPWSEAEDVQAEEISSRVKTTLFTAGLLG